MGEKAVDTADTEGKAKNKEKTTASQIADLLRPFAKKRGKSFIKYAENKNIKKAKLDVDKILEATPMLAKLKTLKDQKFKQSDLESAMAKLVKDSYTYPYILYIYIYIERDFDIYLYMHIYIYMYT
jgi:DICT domain-containing protein